MSWSPRRCVRRIGQLNVVKTTIRKAETGGETLAVELNMMNEEEQTT